TSDELAGPAAHGAAYAGRMARPVPGKPRQGGADGAAGIRLTGGDECRFRVARARAGTRRLPALHDFRGNRHAPGNGERRRVEETMKPKQHMEFVKVDVNAGWERPEGYPPGFWQKILASDIDEKAKRGSRTRLLKIDAGAFSTEPFVHDHWEEVYVVQGDLVVGNDKQGRGGQQSLAPTYAC